MEDILIPAFLFASVVGLAWLVLLFRHRGEQVRHQTMRLMLEKGAEIPPDLLIPRKNPSSDLRRGLILIAIGLGGVVFFWVMRKETPGMWSLGLVPILVGLAYLIFWRLERLRH